MLAANIASHCLMRQSRVLCIQLDGRLCQVAPTPALYIYETVELELSLATVSVETDESLIDYFSCPLRLNRGTAALFLGLCL